jgi:hypothetical protein
MTVTTTASSSTESSQLLPSSSKNNNNVNETNNSSVRSNVRVSMSGLWPIVFGFALGVVFVVATLMVRDRQTSSSSTAANMNSFPLLRSTLGKAKETKMVKHPASHYFGKASTAFTTTLPLMKHRTNSFLADLVTR